MMARLAARAGGPAECGGIEVQYVDPDWGREREPLAASWSRFEVMSPVRGFASFRGSETGGADGGSPAPVLDPDRGAQLAADARSIFGGGVLLAL
jgi:hypothetical protein